MADELAPSAPRSVGRPTVKTEEIVKKLEDVLKLGLSDTVACAHAGISRQTFYDWCKTDAQFSDKMETARNYALLASRELIITRITDPEEKIDKRTELAQWLVEREESKGKGQIQSNTQVNVFNQIREEFLKKPEAVEVTVESPESKEEQNG